MIKILSSPKLIHINCMGHENVFSGDSIRQQRERDPRNKNRFMLCIYSDDNDIHITIF